MVMLMVYGICLIIQDGGKGYHVDLHYVEVM